MRNVVSTGASAASGGRYINVKPTITYNSYPGIFNITNADATANYSANSSVTSGSLSFGANNATITLSSADSVATVANKSTKGVTSSPSTLAERKSYTYTYVVAPPPFQRGCSPYTSCSGTRHGSQCMAFYGSPYTYLNPAPGYNSGGSEWYKIT